MATSINRITLVGLLGADPESRKTNAGATVVNMSVATTKRWRGKDDAMHERTTWHKIVAFDQVADVAERILRKGQRVFIEGEMLYEIYTARDGTQKNKAYVKADQIISMADKRLNTEDGTQSGARAPAPATAPAPAPAYNDSAWQQDVGQDEIPF